MRDIMMKPGGIGTEEGSINLSELPPASAIPDDAEATAEAVSPPPANP